MMPGTSAIERNENESSRSSIRNQAHPNPEHGMKRWALIVLGLYLLILVALTVPLLELGFVSRSDLEQIATMPAKSISQVQSSIAALTDSRQVREVFVYPQYWLWLLVMVLGQAALLVVPVRVASRRPVTRRSLLWPILAAALMMGGLAVGALYSMFEFIYRDKVPSWIWSSALGGGAMLWVVWTLVFYRLSRNAEPGDVVSRQCRLLLKGSILELLIAVPTHIVARARDYCCAGLMTFIGIVLGVSVMLFSFGPSVFFLYVERWRRLHPQSQEAPGQI